MPHAWVVVAGLVASGSFVSCAATATPPVRPVAATLAEGGPCPSRFANVDRLLVRPLEILPEGRAALTVDEPDFVVDGSGVVAALTTAWGAPDLAVGGDGVIWLDPVCRQRAAVDVGVRTTLVIEPYQSVDELVETVLGARGDRPVRFASLADGAIDDADTSLLIRSDRLIQAKLAFHDQQQMEEVSSALIARLGPPDETGGAGRLASWHVPGRTILLELSLTRVHQWLTISVTGPS